jgi:hypothetical protein
MRFLEEEKRYRSMTGVGGEGEIERWEGLERRAEAKAWPKEGSTGSCLERE